MIEPVGSHAFAVDGEDFGWDDVILAADADGRWEELERRTAERLADSKAGEEPARDELRAAEKQFRYDRGLIAADELTAWLDRRGLSVRDWRAHLRRALARGGTVPDAAAEVEELAHAVLVDAICSGELGAAAERLAALAATAAAVAEARPPDAAGPGPRTSTAAHILRAMPLDELTRRGARIAALRATAERFRDAALSDPAIAAVLRAHDIDWLRADCRSLRFTNAEAAREAVLCLTVDAAEPAEVGLRAHVPVETRRLYLDELPPALAHHVVSASNGEVIGPLADDGGHAIVLVDEKVPPDLADAEIRARAEREVLRRARGREVRARVRWHERL